MNLKVAEPPAPYIVNPGAEPAYSADGVDLSLIRWALSLTPAERLRFMRSRASGLRRMKDVADRTAGRDTGGP